MSVPTPPLHTLYPTAEQNRSSIYERLLCSKLAGMVASNYTEDRNLIIFTDGYMDEVGAGVVVPFWRMKNI